MTVYEQAYGFTYLKDIYTGFYGNAVFFIYY